MTDMYSLVKGLSGPVIKTQGFSWPRPILGSNRDKFPSVDTWLQTKNSWSSSDTGISPPVLSPPFVSPIGSPTISYSPRLWPQSVHSFQSNLVKNLVSNLYSDDIKAEFENNGRDVTLGSKSMASLLPESYVQQIPNQYELFGKNGFCYASVGPVAVSNDQSKNRLNNGWVSKNRRKIKTQTFCSFCKNNNETPDVFNSHVVKDMEGRTTCPVLRLYNCPLCNSGGGDDGHTIRYCPRNKPGSEGFVPSVIKQLKSSRSTNGKKRGIDI